MGMTQQLLYTSQIGAGIQQVGGVTMAEFVRGEMGIQSRLGEILLKTAGHIADADRRWLACLGEENR